MEISKTCMMRVDYIMSHQKINMLGVIFFKVKLNCRLITHLLFNVELV